MNIMTVRMEKNIEDKDLIPTLIAFKVLDQEIDLLLEEK